KCSRASGVSASMCALLATLAECDRRASPRIGRSSEEEEEGGRPRDRCGEAVKVMMQSYPHADQRAIVTRYSVTARAHPAAAPPAKRLIPWYNPGRNPAGFARSRLAFRTLIQLRLNIDGFATTP